MLRAFCDFIGHSVNDTECFPKIHSLTASYSHSSHKAGPQCDINITIDGFPRAHEGFAR